MAVRLPVPGPSFLRERTIRLPAGPAAHGHGTRLRRRPRRADRRGTWPPAGAPEAPSGSGRDTALGAAAHRPAGHPLGPRPGGHDASERAGHRGARGLCAGDPGGGPSRVSVARMVGAALSVVVAEPSLWLLGSAGFLVRGGLVLLALPIVTLPSPGGITTLLGPAVVNTGRLEGPLLAAVAAGLLLAAGLCPAGLFPPAWVHAGPFER